MTLLLTGRPGIGKTTAVRAAARKLDRFDLIGFYTEEIRVRGVRRGFRLTTFDGDEAIIAHVELADRVAAWIRSASESGRSA